MYIILVSDGTEHGRGITPRHLQGIFLSPGSASGLQAKGHANEGVPPVPALSRHSGRSTAGFAELGTHSLVVSRVLGGNLWQLIWQHGGNRKLMETGQNMPQIYPNIPKSSQDTGLAVSQIASQIDKWLNLWSRYFVYLMCCLRTVSLPLSGTRTLRIGHRILWRNGAHLVV